MKTKAHLRLITLLVLTLAFSLQPSALLHASPLGTAFTYQGRLADGTNAANGHYDFRFAIYDAAESGSQVGPILTNSAVALSNGLITTTLDFGSVFDSNARWLEIGVRTNGAGNFTTLTPRQRLTAAPHALFAATVASGAIGGTYGNAVALTNAGNSFSGSGAGLTGLNADQLASGTVPDARLSANVPRLSGSATFNGDLGASRLNIGSGHSLSGSLSSIAGGQNNTNQPDKSFIGGGARHWIETLATGGTISGGASNSIRYGATYAAVGGGQNNSINGHSDFSVIGGGRNNAVQPYAEYAVIPGGVDNSATTNAFAAGRRAKADHTGAFVWADATDADFASTAPNQFLVRASGGVGINKTNPATALDVAGTVTAEALSGVGDQPLELKVNGSRALRLEAGIYETVSMVAGYQGNSIYPDAFGSVIAGGGLGAFSLFPPNPNTIGPNAGLSFIGCGAWNTINAGTSVIGGGHANNIGTNAGNSVIGGGGGNTIGTNAEYSVIGGGSGNEIAVGGQAGTIPGGAGNFATNFAFAAGFYAKAPHTGAFVWGDCTFANVASTNANSVTMRASGGYRLFSNSGLTAGVYLAPGGGGWTSMSDRNAKEKLQPVNVLDVLNKLTALPLATWNYKSQDAGVRHIGPMAQDFHAAFGVGESDTGITTIDADGVALAAIQGLNQIVKEKEARIADLEKIVGELKVIVTALNRKVNGGGQ